MILSVLTLLLICILQSIIDTLDLTEINFNSGDDSPSWFGASNVSYSHISPGESSPSLKLKMHFDKSSYYVGDEFIYEVLVQNYSSKNVKIPWQPRRSEITSGYTLPPSGYTAFFMGIEMIADPATTTLIAPISLYGSNSYDKSIVTIQPNSSVRIRCRGIWEKKYFEGKTIDNKKPVYKFRAKLTFLFPPEDLTVNSVAISDQTEVEIIERD